MTNILKSPSSPYFPHSSNTVKWVGLRVKDCKYGTVLPPTGSHFSWSYWQTKENPANQFRIQESLHERLLYGITALHPFSDIVDSASDIDILMSFVLVNNHYKLIYPSLTGHTTHQLVCSQRQYHYHLCQILWQR